MLSFLTAMSISIHLSVHFYWKTVCKVIESNKIPESSSLYIPWSWVGKCFNFRKRVWTTKKKRHLCIYLCDQTVCSDVAHSIMSLWDHAHTRPACPSDLSHTHPRNYSEGVVGVRQRLYFAASGRWLHRCWCRQLVSSWEKTLLLLYFIICSYLTQFFPPQRKCLESSS